MKKITIRVYAIIIQNNRILVVDEYIGDKLITKFPGGGLEFGEGTRDCLKRELREETGLESVIGEHFYTTDFFQQSAFHDSALQVLSVYYRASFTAESKDITVPKFQNQDRIVGFRWLPVELLNVNQFSLPIDKVVVNTLLSVL